MGGVLLIIVKAQTPTAPQARTATQINAIISRFKFIRYFFFLFFS